MTVSNRPRGIESDADRLIDSLFLEIDQVLEQGSRFQGLELRKQEYFSLQTTCISQTKISARWTDSPPGNLCSQSADQLAVTPPDDLVAPTASHDQTLHPETHQFPFWIRHLDKLIFYTAFVIFIASLSLLQKQQPFLRFHWTKPEQTSPALPSENIDTNAQFMSYMERALEEIEREKTQLLQAQPETPSKAETPPLVVSSLPSLPPPPPLIQESSPVAPQPSSTLQNNNQPVKPPTSPPQEANDSTPVSGTVEKSERSEKTLPEMSSYTLVGLLELGEHSAALVKQKGMTQRVMLGERIPGSNWKFVSVANEQATFENNNQQKSMSVGETIPAYSEN
jgi:hypothetical protein